MQTHRTSRDVRFGSEADMTRSSRDVRFTPESGHQSDIVECPLWARSGLLHRNMIGTKRNNKTLAGNNKPLAGNNKTDPVQSL
jgi:hypothetical protein